MKKLRSDSTLAQLTEDQLDQLYDLLSENSYKGTIELAAKPAPDGFGIQFHKATLQRFYAAEQRRRQAERLAALAINTSPNELPPEIAKIWIATRIDFAHATFELASTSSTPDDITGKNYDRVQRALHHFDVADIARKNLELEKDRYALDRDRASRNYELDQDRLQLDRERLAENRRQWEYDASRMALQHAAGLQKVYADNALDNQDKIWAARNICYGASTELTLQTHPSPSASGGPELAPADVQSGQQNTAALGKPLGAQVENSPNAALSHGAPEPASLASAPPRPLGEGRGEGPSDAHSSIPPDSVSSLKNQDFSEARAAKVGPDVPSGPQIPVTSTPAAPPSPSLNPPAPYPPSAAKAITQSEAANPQSSPASVDDSNPPTIQDPQVSPSIPPAPATQVHAGTQCTAATSAANQANRDNLRESAQLCSSPLPISDPPTDGPAPQT